MEFEIEMSGLRPDLAMVDWVLYRADPSAQADLDYQRGALRVACNLTALELVDVLGQAGLGLDPRQVRPLPSICCGGCGG